MRFAKLKNSAQQFLSRYETQDPATYAAAQQAIGGLLILDGFIGIENPLGGKKRSGIFGSLIGVAVGIVFMFIPTIFNSFTGVGDMTATTNATVLSVTQPQISNSDENSSSSCSAVAEYTVAGKQYRQASSFSSSSLCGLSTGTSIPISYNPDMPGTWGYQVQTIEKFIKLFPLFGALLVVASLFTFVIRLASIIFGWKLLQSGRRRARHLPEGNNLGAIISQIRQEFASNIFGTRTPLNPLSSVPGTTPPVPPSPPQPPIAPSPPPQG